MNAAIHWPEVALERYADLLAGFAFKSRQFTDEPSDIPLIKGADVQRGYIKWAGCKRWPREMTEKLDRFWLQEGDVVLAMDRPWVPAGLKWAWIKPGDPSCLLVQRVLRLRGRNGLRTDYLRYLISSPQFADYVRPIVTGVNVPHISGAQILGFCFRLPPAETQRTVAAILSAYDDLIENSKRRIKILEEMAQNLYREWFVKFRFPGHEQVPMVDSPLGKIPEGWEVHKLGDLVELAYGKALKQSDRLDGRIPVYGSSGIVGCHNKPLVSGPGIIVGRKGNVGSVFWSYDDFYAIDTVYFVKTRLPLHYVYYNLQQQNFINNDAAVPGLNRNQAYSLPLLRPANVALNDFSNFIDPLFALTRNLRAKNDTLRQTRDLLLPKLISGELDVSNLDTGKAAA